MTQRWLPVVSAPRYEVSDSGQVRRVSDYGSTYAGRILKHSINKKGGHHVVRLGTVSGVLPSFVHRLVAEAFIGPQPADRPLVAHNDGNPDNNHFSNLRWANTRENFEDRYLHGTDPVGEKNGNARFTETDIRLMRAHAERGERMKVIAYLWDTSPEYAARVVKRRVWAHLEA